MKSKRKKRPNEIVDRGANARKTVQQERREKQIEKENKHKTHGIYSNRSWFVFIPNFS